jgi:hypothetical protein
MVTPRDLRLESADNPLASAKVTSVKSSFSARPSIKSVSQT